MGRHVGRMLQLTLLHIPITSFRPEPHRADEHGEDDRRDNGDRADIILHERAREAP
ncbi:hypothetical protein ABIA27_002321 [Sinorhizobium fredii]